MGRLSQVLSEGSNVLQQAERDVSLSEGGFPNVVESPDLERVCHSAAKG